jgi:hypothetical protein
LRTRRVTKEDVARVGFGLGIVEAGLESGDIFLEAPAECDVTLALFG